MLYLNGHIEVAQKSLFNLGMRWFRCVATSYQGWGVGGEFPHLWRKSVDAAAILRHDFGNVNVIPLHQTCRKSSAQFANFLGGWCLFFIWKMMRRSFRWLKKSPKPFWIPRNKIVPKKSSFGPQLSAATPINHTAINPYQTPAGAEWLSSLGSCHCKSPPTSKASKSKSGKRKKRTGEDLSSPKPKGYGSCWKVDVKNPPKPGERGVRGWCLMKFLMMFLAISDDFWWFLMIFWWYSRDSWLFSDSRTISPSLTWISSTKRRVVEEQHSWCGLLRQRRPARFGTGKTWPNSSTTGMTIIYPPGNEHT